MRKPILKFCLAILLFLSISAAASAQQDLSTPDSLRIGFHAMTDNALYPFPNSYIKSGVNL